MRERDPNGFSNCNMPACLPACLLILEFRPCSTYLSLSIFPFSVVLLLSSLLVLNQNDQNIHHIVQLVLFSQA